MMTSFSHSLRMAAGVQRAQSTTKGMCDQDEAGMQVQCVQNALKISQQLVSRVAASGRIGQTVPSQIWRNDTSSPRKNGSVGGANNLRSHPAHAQTQGYAKHRADPHLPRSSTNLHHPGPDQVAGQFGGKDQVQSSWVLKLAMLQKLDNLRSYGRRDQHFRMRYLHHRAVCGEGHIGLTS